MKKVTRIDIFKCVSSKEHEQLHLKNFGRGNSNPSAICEKGFEFLTLYLSFM